MLKDSWQEAAGFNHRSTDVKSAGARMNNIPDSGAKSSLHRPKVGGGRFGGGVKMRPESWNPQVFSPSFFFRALPIFSIRDAYAGGINTFWGQVGLDR
jgi:hypothetical protein